MFSFPRTILAITVSFLMLIPAAFLLTPSHASAVQTFSMEGKTLGGDPGFTSGAPFGYAVVGRSYSYNAISTSPDNGTIDWTLVTNALWLAISDGGVGYEYCNVTGVPASVGVFWANLTINDTDSYNYLNWTIDVKAPGLWGFVETMSSLSTGTHDPATLDLLSGRLSLINVDSDEESVILDGKLYEFSRTSHTNVTVARYEPVPIDDGLGWNMSVELYPTREESSYKALLKPVPTLGMLAYLSNGTDIFTGVALYVGDSTQGYENVMVFNASSSTWSNVSTDIIPSYPNRHDDHPEAPRFSESIYGEGPDHYLVSFRYVAGTSSCEITIIHTSEGIIGKIQVDLPAVLTGTPKLVLVSDVAIPYAAPGTFSQLGYWVVDNICFRGLAARHPIAGPVYEYVTKGYPYWVSVKDIDGNVVADADVTIAGLASFYIPSRQRYEVVGDLPVGWNQQIDYSVAVDGIAFSDRLAVTVMPDLDGEKVSLPLWWNGWAWATVFGRDDSASPTSAPDTYSAYNHPGTSYVQTASGPATSDDLLPTQSEIGLHFPHDNLLWPRKFWSEAVDSADQGHGMLESAYTFASRWDNPAYVGVGDMYISIACPGNSGSWEQMYAQYARGTRIMGFTSNYYNGAPGNFSLIGSWYLQMYPVVETQWRAPNSQWYPYTSMDMMDAARGPNTDVELPSYEWQVTFWMAEHGGVRRIYNHGSISGTDAVFLSWIDNPKTNFSYENWKATDGEVASYVYGRWSTDVVFDPFASNNTITAYDVSRRDPIAAGYWRVPVTIAFNASGRTLSDIQISEGSTTLRVSDGSLRNITGKRIMDTGFDIRGDTIYVSQFWNQSSRLSFIFSDEVPAPNTPPVASFVVDSYYGNVSKVFVFDATSTYDVQDPLSLLVFRWDWDADGSWDTDWFSNPIAHHQFLIAGNHTVRLQVMDRGSLTGEFEAYVEVTDIAIPEYPTLLVPIIGLLATVAVLSLTRDRRGKHRRSV